MAASPQTDSSERKNVSEQKMGCAAAWYFSCTTSMPSVEVLSSSSKIGSKIFQYYLQAGSLQTLVLRLSCFKWIEELKIFEIKFYFFFLQMKFIFRLHHFIQYLDYS